MNRRDFLFSAAAGGYFLLESPSSAFAQQGPVFLNGTVNGDGFLEWSIGGGDPLQEHLRADGFRAALALPRLNLSPGLQSAIRNEILSGNPEPIDIRMYERQTLEGVMVSGSGWLAVRPRIRTDLWPRRRFDATSWFVTYTRPDGTVERWQVIAVGICGNLILIPRGGPLPCICVPGQDACGK